MFGLHISLKTAVVTAVVAAAAFAAGVYWSHSAGSAAAAGDPPGAQAQQRGWLGMALAPVTDAVASRLGIPKQDGLVVLRVVPNGPAAKAGVQEKDVVKAINGQTVTDLKAAMGILKNVKPGDKVDLNLNGAKTVSVTAEAAPARQGPDGPHRGGKRGFGLGVLPNLPELQGIAPGQFFDHVVGGSFKLKDKDGKDLTINVVAGKVTAASDASVTVAPNGGGPSQTFSITADTRLPGKGSDLKADTKVVVVTKNNETTALAIRPVGQRTPLPAGVAQALPLPMLAPAAMGVLEGVLPSGGLPFWAERQAGLPFGQARGHWAGPGA